MIAFKGVRNSCDTEARKADFNLSAASALDRASSASCF